MATRTNRKTTRKPASTRARAQAAAGNGDAGMSAEAVEELTRALKAARDGDFTQRLPSRRGSPTGQLGAAYNDLVEMLERMTKEFVRVGRVVGREGRMGERLSFPSAKGSWVTRVDSVNALIDDLARPTTEVARVIEAVAEGDLTQKMALKIEGQPVRGEFLRIGTAVNGMVDQLRSFADEVTRVAQEVGTEGKLGGQAKVKGVSGTWKGLTDSVNLMASNLTAQVRDIAEVTTAVANGDLSQKITVDVKGEILELKDTINTMVDQLRSFAGEVTRVAREVGTDGRLGGQARVEGVSGTWRDLTENVNFMASNLTDQVRNISQVATAVAAGDLTKKITVEAKGEVASLADTINSMTDTLQSFVDEVTRVAREVGTEGKLGGQARVEGVLGVWRGLTENVNSMASNLTSQVRDIAAVTTAVASGDLTQKITVDVKGEILELKDTINTMVDQLSSFADEVTRVAREVGTEGKLGGQARVEGVSGTWRDLTENVNFMASNLTDQVRSIADVTTAVANGDLTRQITVETKGEVAALAETINTMVDRLSTFADEVTRVAREVGTEGKLGGQAKVEGVSGTWKGLTENVNFMASNLTSQVRNISQVATRVANGDLSQKITVEAKGEVAALAETLNSMTDTLQAFASEVTRVAREVGTDGKLGGQAKVEGVAGTWKDLTDSVNFMASNLTDQVRDIAAVTTAVARGDMTQKIKVDVKGEILELKNTINTMVDQLSSFADEVTRVAREVGTEGKLGGQAQVKGVSGTWKDLTDNVNFMASNLTSQVRNIAQVATAVAKGDLTQKITVDVKGEILELKDTLNTMVDQLSSFADEVTRVAREVGTEGRLGGQADVKGVSGTWRDLTNNVNFMGANLTDQVRNIAAVTTAVAQGDLSKKITVDAKGEILELKDTINTMVDQLSSFAAEVTRVAKEVGTEGKLGGQAEVEDVSGVWRGLTTNVNQMATSLTAQVRAIADVASAVTEGDLTRSITVEAQGEVSELKDKINQMIANLADTTKQNEEQDWLKSNLARITGLLQGQRDLQEVTKLIMSELTPTVAAQHGAFFLVEGGEDVSGHRDGDGSGPVLRLKASYGYKARKSVSNRFSIGEGLVGQAALEQKSILITEAPQDYIKVTSGLGESAPVNIIVVPVLFEDHVLGVIELASLRPFSEVNQTFLDQLIETLGVVLNSIIANTRTEELLAESQRLTRELQSQSEELQTQQEELQQTNEELQEKAAQLAEQNREVEVKNRQVEMARASLEEKAQQLAMSSKYKSEFLANMSHELRTPLNSLLILAKMMRENAEGNLTDKQVEFASTIYTSGSDLLNLINDILDLTKVEAGKMDVNPAEISLSEIRSDLEQSFRPVADEKGLDFVVSVSQNAPSRIVTDGQRLQQVLNNLLSNAFKFTESGSVKVNVKNAPKGMSFQTERLIRAKRVVAFSVTDTGIGIPEEKLKLIFEAFQQADGTTSRRFGGTGLGLSISREIARLLGGEIRVESREGRGSTFTIYLPDSYEPSTEPDLPRIELGTPVVVEVPPGQAAAEASEEMPNELADDRATLQPGDKSLLVVQADPDLARRSMGAARAQGFKALGSVTAETGIALARDLQPDAILIDSDPDGLDGLVLLRRLKAEPTTRHIPVFMIAKPNVHQDAFRSGAAACIERPGGDEDLRDLLSAAVNFVERSSRSLLIVEDDETERKAITELIGAGDEVEIHAVGSSEDALALLSKGSFDCMVVDLKLPDMTGFDLLEMIRKTDEFKNLPVIVYTGTDLTRREETRLKKLAESVIVKDARSPERLLEEASLFLHRAPSRMPEAKRKMIEKLEAGDEVFAGKRVLIVDDDVRNAFALTSVIEAKGIEVLYAENGRDAIEALNQHPEIDLVLMDIMMPDMDGYETTKAIRSDSRFADLPIVALTAKAMKGDREKSIASGASDYIPKPVDTEQLFSLMRVWLYK
jgi:HAMP domain-containing protein/signal transduction histidine kinase/DNA-binding response OmpR family regulator